MALSKEELRKQLRLNRKELTNDKVIKNSQKIVGQCLNLIPWQKIHSLHTYMPIETRHEINTLLLLQHVWQQMPQSLTAVPVMDGLSMNAVEVTSTTKWRNNPIGIPEPVSGEVLPADFKFDIIIVPMLGFDKEGYRLGNGGGHYDRFLRTQPQALTIGLSYEIGRLDNVFPHEPHDIPLKYIVTEKRTLSV